MFYSPYVSIVSIRLPYPFQEESEEDYRCQLEHLNKMMNLTPLILRSMFYMHEVGIRKKLAYKLTLENKIIEALEQIEIVKKIYETKMPEQYYSQQSVSDKIEESKRIFLDIQKRGMVTSSGQSKAASAPSLV